MEAELAGELCQAGFEGRARMRQQPAAQDPPQAWPVALPSQTQAALGHLPDPRTAAAGSQMQSPALTEGRQFKGVGRKRRLRPPQRAPAPHLLGYPFAAAVEECAGVPLGDATGHHELDAAIQMHAHRHAPRPFAETHAGLAERCVPQPKLHGRQGVVGYPLAMTHTAMIAVSPPPDLVDIGANLTHESFQQDLDAVMKRAADSGVQRLVVTGTSVAGTQAAIDLHARWPDRLFATCGIHPHHAAELDDAAYGSLREMATRAGVVAIGECGLDYYRNYSPRAAQLAAFRRQLELAVQAGKPVFLHQRDAHADFAAIVREFRSSLVGGVAHCFTGHAAELEECLELDLAIGITGWICDERRGRHLLPLVREIPRGRLMIETDAPYLLPRSLRPAPGSRRNEPAFLVEVARVVAAARQESLEELAVHSTAAAQAFFALPAANG